MSKVTKNIAVIKSVRPSMCVDYGIDNVDARFEKSLQEFLKKNLKTQFEHDYFYCLECGNPNCHSLHAIRYFFTDTDFSKADVAGIEQQLNKLLNVWVAGLSTQYFKF